MWRQYSVGVWVAVYFPVVCKRLFPSAFCFCFNWHLMSLCQWQSLSHYFSFLLVVVVVVAAAVACFCFQLSFNANCQVFQTYTASTCCRCIAIAILLAIQYIFTAFKQLFFDCSCSYRLSLGENLLVTSHCTGIKHCQRCTYNSSSSEKGKSKKRNYIKKFKKICIQIELNFCWN